MGRFRRTIALKYPARCADCGADLPAGSLAVYYGARKVYGRGCHSDSRPARSYRAPRVSGPCEDAPCCGCCGPHTGGYGDPYAYTDNLPD